HLSLLNKKSNSSSPLSLSEILEMVRMNADVPDDFEEYCESWFRDPSDRICRIDYLADLRRAKRLKKFFSKEEIKSIPFLPNDDRNENVKDKNIDSIIDFNNKSDLKLLGYSVIYLNDKKEYDKLAELMNSLEYHTKIVKSYGYNSYTGDVDEKKFPVTKEDKQMKGIKKNFDNYFQALEEYNEYLKELVKKYDIKPTGNLVKRLAFNIHVNDDYNGSNSKQQQHPEFITSVIDFKDFSDV
ncbi:MAG TPA: hypothetical protein VIY98_13260, partial [Nitrososphaeraceae archaeon]